MAYENPGKQITLAAAADLSALRYTGVVIDANGRAAAQVVDGGPIDGILQNKPAALDRGATVMKNGLSKAVAGAAVASGDDLAVTATGQFITAVAGKRRVARAVSAAGAALDIITVALGNDGIA